MSLAALDWIILIAFFAILLTIGLWSSRKSGENYQEFFLSGRGMPWWLLGTSMVATTFSADTPNLVTDIVRKNGVAGNWAWWAFLLTGMLTVFVYAKLWRRSGILTDLEFYEMRYSGKAAAFLRGFRSLYLGVLFNVMIMATVSLAAIKIGGTLLGLSPLTTIVVSSVVVVFYAGLGGLRGVILTDFFQFTLAMTGMVLAAIYLVNLPEVGGLNKLLTHEAVSGKLSVLPDLNNWDVLVPLLIIPLAVQWWSVWYPGAEPGGGGYVVQRMLSAKDETNAVGATLLFNIAHYALRPWPWILIALTSLVVFPDLDSLRTAFPKLGNKIQDDMAFPAMMTLLPSGLLGLIVAALIAAFMSTIASHLNWGSSYVVNDFYKRFIKPEAEGRELVLVGRLSTVGLMIFAALFALALSNALQAFNILLQIGAGTGLIFILRWFWWRINAYSELAGMIASFLVAVYFQFLHPEPLPDWQKLLIGVAITTVGWVSVTMMTRPDDYQKLLAFYKLIKPHPTGWRPVIREAISRGDLRPEEVRPGKLPTEIAAMIAGCFMVYSFLFSIGFWIYGQGANALIATGVALASTAFLVLSWRKIMEKPAAA